MWLFYDLLCVVSRHFLNKIVRSLEIVFIGVLLSSVFCSARFRLFFLVVVCCFGSLNVFGILS